MKLYKVTAEIETLKLETTIKAGVIGTIEMGLLDEDGQELPEYILTLVVSDEETPSAWAQFSKMNDEKRPVVINEGWITSGPQPTGLGFVNGVSGNISLIENPTANLLKEHSSASFLSRRCCTSTGSRNGQGCYVRCCGVCCSDPSCSGCSCCP